jgi:molecular chaperone DnaK
MFLGIDLGTSNSAIVGSTSGSLRLFKTPEGHDTLPSAVMIDKRGGIHVGRRAYEQAAYSPESVAQGFKRLLGTSSPIVLNQGQNVLDAETASKEILLALVNQARAALGQAVEPKGTVVTIPAAFNQMQTEATMRACAEANLGAVALLQEPVAAAMASIAKSSNKSGQFLIYDLGGGTFDAAIVQSIAGSATVVAHSGINMLGGRDFDRAIFNGVVRQWLLQTFKLDSNFHADPKFQRLIRIALYRAEQSKIALSTQESDRIFSDETQISTKDNAGSAIYLDVQLNRSDLERLVAEEIEKTVDQCSKLIESNGYQVGDLDRVVMIGGPSRMPIVQRLVTERLGIPLEVDIDPMIAVASGAAIFAESRKWGAVTAKEKHTPKSANSLRYQVRAPSQTASSKIKINVKRTGSEGRRIQLITSDGWSSGFLDMQDSEIDVKDIPIKKSGSNKIILQSYDLGGRRIEAEDISFQISRVGAIAEGMPTTHSISIKIVEGASGQEKNVLDEMVRKGTQLPARGVKAYRAARTMHANDGSELNFEVYEQQDGVDAPDLNLPIGVLQIRSDELQRGDVIKRGDIVEVNWNIDENGLLDCSFNISAISRSYSAARHYVSSHNHRNFDGSEGDAIARSDIQKAEQEVLELDRVLGSRVSNDYSKIKQRIRSQFEALDSASDSEDKRRVSEEARHIRQDIARIKSHSDNVRFVMRSEIDGILESVLKELKSLLDEKTVEQVERLGAAAREALLDESKQGLVEARRSIEEMRALVFAGLAKQPAMWVTMFNDLAEQRHAAIDKQLHDRLVSEGNTSCKENDVDSLRRVVFQIQDNMTQRAGAGLTGLSGLMRL